MRVLRIAVFFSFAVMACDGVADNQDTTANDDSTTSQVAAALGIGHDGGGGPVNFCSGGDAMLLASLGACFHEGADAGWHREHVIVECLEQACGVSEDAGFHSELEGLMQCARRACPPPPPPDGGYWFHHHRDGGI
jgi:hypothetical protein